MTAYRDRHLAGEYQAKPAAAAKTTTKTKTATPRKTNKGK